METGFATLRVLCFGVDLDSSGQYCEPLFEYSSFLGACFCSFYCTDSAGIRNGFVFNAKQDVGQSFPPKLFTNSMVTIFSSTAGFCQTLPKMRFWGGGGGCGIPLHQQDSATYHIEQAATCPFARDRQSWKPGISRCS